MNEQLFSALTTVGLFLQQELMSNLINQGHKASGQLAESIQFEILPFGDGQVLEISFFDYGNFVDFGRLKGKKRVPIPALVEWIKIRAIERGDANVLRAAFAIREAIFKQGIPTRGSLKFSSTGKRTGWFTDVADSTAVEERIVEIVADGIFKDAEIFIDNIIAVTRKDFEAV